MLIDDDSGIITTTHLAILGIAASCDGTNIVPSNYNELWMP